MHIHISQKRVRGRFAGRFQGGLGVERFRSLVSTASFHPSYGPLLKDAMGLPDPVAFAMLVALGAIPDPMALLNEMMATPNEEEEKAAFWKSGQMPLATAEASDSAELERLAKQVLMIRGRWDFEGRYDGLTKTYRNTIGKKFWESWCWCRASKFFMWIHFGLAAKY